jgi:hypothetical protein
MGKKTVRYGKEDACIMHGHNGSMNSKVRRNVSDNA